MACWGFSFFIKDDRIVSDEKEIKTSKVFFSISLLFYRGSECLYKNKFIKGFTAKYSVDKLVYYEVFDDINEAILREKQLKGGSRAKKIALIEKENPLCDDLYEKIM